ncbi:MerR family transcriptional regulator [Companilactobacillus sp. HBUAS59699]|uniref:MerR family transcriptional regulator n=1 Tax=Companilactobacillus sp. HBUAS59699 TaxID=3109358 RepID=UPI002FF2F142
MAKANMDKLHTIGETAKICGVSRKTLRFYEELGLLVPDYVCPDNGYRYYSDDTLNMVPILKYYKQMGFHLQEMNGVGDTCDCFFHERNFLTKLDELKKEEKELQNRYQAIYDWVGMLHEGNMAIENGLSSITLKYVEQEQYYSLEQDFKYDYKDSIINLPWINHLEEYGSAITGPVILSFNNYQEKAAGTISRATIMQKPVRNDPHRLQTKDFGGQMYLCTYNVGAPNTSASKYHDLEVWAKNHGYELSPECYERYLVDYWATKDENSFVCEIMVPAEKIS